MKRVISAVISLGLLMTACGPGKDERVSIRAKSAANTSEQPAIDPEGDNPETPVADQPVDEVPGIDPVSNPPVTTTPAVTPAPITSNNGVPMAVQEALKAALKGIGTETPIKVYNFYWLIDQVGIAQDGNQVSIEGTLTRKKCLDFKQPLRCDKFANFNTFSDTATFEFVYENGKLISSDIAINDKKVPVGVIAAALSAVGMAYGVVIPVGAVNGIVAGVEKLLENTWDASAQKLALRIAMEAYRKYAPVN